MGLILSAVALYILVGVFSSGTESSARWKILAISIGSLVIELVVVRILPGLAGFGIALIVAMVLIAAALIFWCGVERKSAVKISASYLAISVAFTVITVLLQRH